MNDKELRRIVEETVNGYRASVRELKLDTALSICEAVRARAAELGVRAVVCVSDGGGHPIAVQCMDDAYIASYDIAVNKAYTVVALKMSTSTLKPMAQPGQSLYVIQFTNGGRIVIFGGGEPLCGEGGRVLGGLGVSGGSEEQDTELAAYGLEFFRRNFG